MGAGGCSVEQMLKDKVAIVTGGSAGIGKAIARAYVTHGAKVVIVGRDQERGERALADILHACPGGRLMFYRADVSNEKESQELVQDVIRQEGKIDILVNNAGITRDNLILKMSQDDWDQVLDVNVKSCYNLCRAVTRPMLKARQGKIINMSSVVGQKGNAGQVNYSASKAAVNGLTKALSRELASRNITVNSIAPGFIETEMTRKLPDDKQKEFRKEIPMRRFGKPEDVANVALFLASDLANYVTGQVLTVDGGYL